MGPYPDPAPSPAPLRASHRTGLAAPARTPQAFLSRRLPFRYRPAMRPRTVVFVEPPYVCWDRRRDRVREGEEEIPGIGTLTLAAVVREHGHRVHIVDRKRTGTPVEQGARAVAAPGPRPTGRSAPPPSP